MAKVTPQGQLDNGPTDTQLGTMFADSIKTVARAMDEHETSAWLAGLGVILIAYALSTQEGSWSHIQQGEFIAVLITGVVFVLTGVVYRFYARLRADEALRRLATTEVGEAEGAKRRALELIEKLAGEPQNDSP